MQPCGGTGNHLERFGWIFQIFMASPPPAMLAVHSSVPSKVKVLISLWFYDGSTSSGLVVTANGGQKRCVWHLCVYLWLWL